MLRWEDNIRMALKEIGINTRNWVDSVQEGLLESPCKWDIEPPGFISNEVGRRSLSGCTEVGHLWQEHCVIVLDV